MVDLLVIGGGLAGSMAALAATQENPQATVRLLRPASNRFDGHPGTIDVLGSLPDDVAEAEAESGGFVTSPIDAIEFLSDDHPYRLLGVETLIDVVELFDAELGYHGTERNALVLTHAGHLRPTMRYPSEMAAGLASRDEPMRLVGFEQIPDFDARFLSERFSELLPYETSHSTVAFPGTVTEYPAAPVLADALDSDQFPHDTVGQRDEEPPAGLRSEPEPDGSVREELIRRLLPELDTESRLGFPAVLGDSRSDAVRTKFETQFGARVFEVPTGPPSIAGRRLESRLLDALEEAGVVVENGDIAEFETSNSRIEQVTISGSELPVESVVLATGDLTGPGLTADRTGVREPRFDCYISHPDDRNAWTSPQSLTAQPFARFGVQIDGECRPVDASGRPEYSNLRVAGRIIGGVDYDREGSADGVSLVTGYVAGQSGIL